MEDQGTAGARDVTAAGGQPPPAAPPARGRIVALAAAQTLSWASLYYVFPALLPHWERSLGWSKAELAGAFTVALLVSAAWAPVAGRLVDRGHGRVLLTGSAFAGGLLMALLSRVEATWQFYAVWMGIGVAMGGALYEPCFAHLTHCLGTRARRAITLITLVAGFAGSVSFPAAYLLAGAFGWRGAVIACALGACLLSAPLMWFGAGLNGAGRTHESSTRGTGQRGAYARALRLPAFWLLAASFAMIALNHGVLITHLLPLLAERQVAPGTAVLAAALIGPMQVLGRVLMLSVEQRVSMAAVCLASYLALAGAAGALYAAAALPALLFVFVMFQGSGYGVTSITRPVITAEYLGREGFGVISGVQAAVYMAAFAAAPTAAALLWELGGYDLVLGVCLVCALAAAACFLGATWLRPR